MPVIIRRIDTADPSWLPGLCRLLQDVVDGGASVGFLAPLSEDDASAYWRHIFTELSGTRRLWVAEVDGEVAGSVQLDPCLKQNGRHRAEIQKLIVHRDFRGEGISSRLMAEAEAAAKSIGCTLLVLDTEAQSHAEAVYQHLGWTPCGGVPGFALGADGVPRTNAYYYKQLVR